VWRKTYRYSQPMIQTGVSGLMGATCIERIDPL
jgi:hypothetical protein